MLITANKLPHLICFHYRQAFSFVPDVSSARVAASQILRLMDSAPEIDADGHDGKIASAVQGHLELRDVHFQYRALIPLLFCEHADLVYTATRPAIKVLRGINMEIRPGSYVAIVGASGSGYGFVIMESIDTLS